MRVTARWFERLPEMVRGSIPSICPEEDNLLVIALALLDQSLPKTTLFIEYWDNHLCSLLTKVLHNRAIGKRMMIRLACGYIDRVSRDENRLRKDCQSIIESGQVYLRYYVDGRNQDKEIASLECNCRDTYTDSLYRSGDWESGWIVSAQAGAIRALAIREDRRTMAHWVALAMVYLALASQDPQALMTDFFSEVESVIDK